MMRPVVPWFIGTNCAVLPFVPQVSIDEFAKYLCTPVPSMTPNIEELQKQLGA